MKTAVIILGLITAASAGGQVLTDPNSSAFSHSGQFTVIARRSAELKNLPRAAIAGTNNIQLEPTFVAVSAERIKQVIWRELGMSGPWQNKIHLTLFPTRTAGEPATIITGRSLGRWDYRVEMPDQIPADRYLRALVHVVLLEFANRDARERSAELPAWLVEGVTFQLVANHSAELVITPPRLTSGGIAYSPLHIDFRRVSIFERAHQILFGAPPLTLEELSWPSAGQTDGEDGGKYRASAQLFTYKLLELRGGQGCMCAFLRTLPAYLNWQFAFLDGFQPHFARPLDIEKWWALQSSGFAGRSLTETWTPQESWAKLTAALLKPVDVFAGTNQLPTRSEVKLQTIVGEWKSNEQEAVLREKIHELEALRYRIAPELGSIAAEYQQTLQSFLARPGSPAHAGRLDIRPLPSAIRRAQRDAVSQLDMLDARLELLKPTPSQAAEPPRATDR